MGGVMRPVGPESAETYWVRRALVVGGLLVLLILVLIFLFNLGGSPGQAAPAPARSAVPAGGPSDSAPTSPSASATGPSSTPSSVQPSATSTATATPSAQPSDSNSATTSPSPSTKPSAGRSDQAENPKKADKPDKSDKPDKPDKASGKPSDKSSTEPSRGSSTKPSSRPSSKPSSKPAAAAACTANQLRPELKSRKHTVSVGSKVAFGVSYSNRSDQPCSVKINADDYQLTIFSGSDRIWSTEDCARLVRPTATTLKPGAAVVWTMTWNGKRSAQGETCRNRPETPKPGYYHVTSKLAGVRSLDYVLVLR